MYKHILIATDGSELAAKAVTTGLQLAAALGARDGRVRTASAVPMFVEWFAGSDFDLDQSRFL